MESIESAKRNMMGTRLEMAKLCAFLGKEPWVVTSNAAFDGCTTPSVTVIITLYNYADYIKQCLDSVCATITDPLPGGFDVLIIDDCSTDESASLVEDYLKNFKTPICLVKKAFNTGLADARNTGLHLARAPFVFILDADNWIYPNCLSVLYKAIHTSGSAGVYGIINRFNSKTGKGAGLISFYEWDVRELLTCPYIDAMAMFKKDILLKVGGYSTELMVIAWSGWEDYDLWLKLAQAGYDARLVPNILSAYRVHPNSMIHTTNAYTEILVQHFKKKFSKLIEQYDDMTIVFGAPRHGEHQTSSSTQAQLQEAQVTLKRVRQNLQKTRAELAEAQERTAAMETSKFWKLRKSWLHIKRFFRISKEQR
ncbi:MAG: glycosyltransferase family 2 protein [Timaviella obliquedivisa GSE-PSE-MK23-08B]|jgi:glycosyltransferase involved in cell wall biosynthesis|nr:glycosyltransferase family 2 protein [Timaviella obliquedivisa GSE-PSE-MK23-08B]